MIGNANLSFQLLEKRVAYFSAYFNTFKLVCGSTFSPDFFVFSDITFYSVCLSLLNLI